MNTAFELLISGWSSDVCSSDMAVIVTLILLGRFLEARAKGRTSEAIKRLVGLQAKTARGQRDGTVLDIPIADVVAGDIIQVRPGERIHVDGHTEDRRAGTECVSTGRSRGSPAHLKNNTK